MIRKATASDIDAIAAIYEAIHDACERGDLTVGWIRGVYPVRGTAEDALDRDDLFVLEDEGTVVGAFILNQRQEESYAKGEWLYEASPEEVMVGHTLVVDPARNSQGYAHEVMRFYEDYAREQGCTVMRFDTSPENKRARALYADAGCREAGIITEPRFHDLGPMELVLLEKKL